MSMQTDCIYGYGFEVYVSDEQLRDFILKHRFIIETLPRGRELLNYTDENIDDKINPKEDFYDWQSINANDDGIYGVIADVMYKETGIRFEYRVAQDDDEEDAILLPERLPWDYNAAEKVLAPDVLKKILKSYIKELGGQLNTDYIRMEFFG